MAIDTHIPQIKKPTNYIYTARNLAINDISYTDGDGTLSVPRFDSYVMFDFDQTDVNGQKEEVDFSGMGDAYLCFVDNNIEVKIKNLNNIENINKGLGQVVFKITSDEARKIYSIQSKYFFVTTKITQLNSFTEETVVYSGIWQKSGDTERTTFADLIFNKENEYDSLSKKYDTLYESFQKQQLILSNSASVLEEEKNKTTILNDSIYKIQVEIEKARQASTVNQVNVGTTTTPISPTATPAGTPDSVSVVSPASTTVSNEEKVKVIDHSFFGDTGTESKLSRLKFLTGMNTLLALVLSGIKIPEPSFNGISYINEVDIDMSDNTYKKFLALKVRTNKLLPYYFAEFNDYGLKVGITKSFKTDFQNIIKIDSLRVNIQDLGETKIVNCTLKEAIAEINENLVSANQNKLTIL